MSAIDKTLRRSIETMKGLEPATRAKVADFVMAVLSELGVAMLVYSGFRDYAEQWDLRVKHLAGGPLAAAPGYSWHNFGRAVDAVPTDKEGRAVWNSPLWPKIIAIAKRYGLESGIAFGDTNHFANKEGDTLANLRTKNPVPIEYIQQDMPEVPKDIEPVRRVVPNWFRWTAAIGLAGLLAFLYYDYERKR